MNVRSRDSYYAWEDYYLPEFLETTPIEKKFLSDFPEFTMSEGELEIAKATAKQMQYFSIHEAAEKLVFLPNWSGAFGSYGAALRAFHERAEYPNLVDFFIGLPPDEIDKVVRHASIEERLLNNPSVPKVGNFFIVGCNFRLWRRGEKGKDVLKHLFPTEIPAGLLDCFYLTHYYQGVPSNAFLYGVGALGDLLDSGNKQQPGFGGLYQESGGQFSEDTFRFRSLHKVTKSFISFFVPEPKIVPSFRSPFNKEKKTWEEPPKSWDEAVKFVNDRKFD